MTPSVAYKSRLHEMTQSTAARWWNKSASIQASPSSIADGAVGATCNPVIVLEVLKKELPLWKGRIQQLIREMPTAGEDEIAWRVVEEISVKAAELLVPAFKQHGGRNGRLSVQTD